MSSSPASRICIISQHVELPFGFAMSELRLTYGLAWQSTWHSSAQPVWMSGVPEHISTFGSWGHFSDESSWSGICLKNPYEFSGPAIKCLILVMDRTENNADLSGLWFRHQHLTSRLMMTCDTITVQWRFHHSLHWFTFPVTETEHGETKGFTFYPVEIIGSINWAQVPKWFWNHYPDTFHTLLAYRLFLCSSKHYSGEWVSKREDRGLFISQKCHKAIVGSLKILSKEFVFLKPYQLLISPTNFCNYSIHPESISLQTN